MYYLEIFKRGHLVQRRALTDEEQLGGCWISLSNAAPTCLLPGEQFRIDGLEARVVAATQSATPSMSVQSVPPITVVRETSDNEGTLEIPETVSVEGYRIESLIGAGGMGSVWRAIELSTHRTVAVKIMHPGSFASRRARMRFEREIELSARLDHPGIARVYHSGLFRGQYFFAMEYVRGRHLNEYVAAQRTPRDEILRLLIRIFDAVAHAHEQGVLHRDLTPANILVTESGDPRVLDFGLAAPVDRSATAEAVSVEGHVPGTLIYMSPEQAAGQSDRIDVRSEVYSLAVIAYQLLLGQHPHNITGSELEIRNRIVTNDFLMPRRYDRHCHRDLEAILVKGLSTDRGERYASVAAFAQDLRLFLAGLPVTARALTPSYVAKRWIARHRLIASSTLGVVVIMLTFAITTYLNIAAARRAAESSAAAERHAHYLTNINFARNALDSGDLALAQSVLSQCRTELRDWEWRRLNFEANQAIAMVDPSIERIIGVWPLPNGELFVVAQDGTAQTWAWSQDAPSRTTTLTDRRIASMAVAGRLAVFANYSGEIRSIDIPHHRSDAHGVAVHDGGVRSLAIDPGTGRIASIGRGDNSLCLWDSLTGERLFRIALHDRMGTVRFNKAGDILAAGDRVWRLDPKSGSVLAESSIFGTDAFQGVAVDPLERLLVAFGQVPGVVHFFDPLSLSHLHTAEVPSEVTAAEFSADGSLVTFAHRDGSITAWRAESRELIGRLSGHTSPVLGLTFLGETLISFSSDRVALWSLQPSGTGTATPVSDELAETYAVKLAMTTSGSRLFVTTLAGLYEFDLNDPRQSVRRLSEEPLTRSVLACSDRYIVNGGASGLLAIQAVDGREPPATIPFNEPIDDLAARPQSSMVAVSSGGMIHLLDIEERRAVREFPGRGPLTWSSNGLLVGFVSHGSDDRALVIWDTSSPNATQIARWPAQDDAIAVACSDNGQLLAWSEQSGELTIIDRSKRASPLRLSPSGAHMSIRSIEFLPESTRFITAGQELRVWDATSGRPVLTLARSTSAHRHFTAVAVARAAEAVATVDSDGAISVYRTHSTGPPDP